MTSKFKIVLLGSAHPLRGGLSTYNERLASTFQEHGHEATIYSFSLQYPEIFFPGKSQFATGAAPEGLKILTKVNSINPFNWISVGLEIKKQRPDFLIVKYWLPFMAPCLGTICRIVKSNGHTKIISILDNVLPHEKRVGDKMFSKYFVGSCDGFLAMSKSVLDDLKQFTTRKKTTFNPHPLFDSFGKPITKEEAKRQLQLDPNFNYILFFGFIRAYKGLDILLEAFSDKRLRELPLKLIIAGEYYDDENIYKQIINKNGLKDFVIQSNDFIPNEEVAKYFCAADLVVQPYKSATQSGVTQIGYFFDKPMLVTNVGGLPEIIPDGKVGYVVEPNPQAIADAILDFYVNKNEQKFIEGVKEEKKKYSWDALYDKLIVLYRDLKSS